MNTLTRWIQSVTGLEVAVVNHILASLIIVGVLWGLQTLLIWLVNLRSKSPRTRYRWGKTVHYTAIALGLVLIVRVWLEGLPSLANFLGLVSAGLAIALSDLVIGLAGWVFILTRRPFEVGDRIQLGEFRGDVIDLRPFAFSLVEIGNWVDADQSTGRIIHVPNGKVFKEPLANYTQGFAYIWHEIPVLVTFESNWEEAKRIVNEAVHRHAETALGLRRAARADGGAALLHRFFKAHADCLYERRGQRHFADDALPLPAPPPPRHLGSDLGGYPA